MVILKTCIHATTGKPIFLALLATAGGWLAGNAQTVIPLYPDAIPNSKPVEDAETAATDDQGNTRISKVSRPTLTVYLPSKEKDYRRSSNYLPRRRLPLPIHH